MEQEKKRINFRYNMASYWEIMRKYKLMIAGLLLVVVIIVLSDIVVSYLFKIIVDEGTSFLAGTLTKDGFIRILLIVAGVYLINQAIFLVARWSRPSLNNKLETQVIFDIKKKYFNHLIGLSHNFYAKNKTGSLIARLLRGGNAIERITDVLVFNWIPMVVQLISILAILIYFDLTIALMLIIISLVFITYNFFLQRLQESSSLEANRREDIEKANIADIFTNIDSIKYFGKENYIRKRFSKLADKTRKAFLKNWNYGRLIGTGSAAIVTTGSFLIILFSVLSVLEGTMTIGTLVFIYSIYGKLIGQLYSFVNGIKGFYRSMADFQDLFEYGKIEPQIKDREGAKKLEIKKGEIEFQNVNFSYSKRKILKNFNLKVNKNEKIALVGHSGCGKTTLIKLLYRLYDVTDGAILIDGKDIRDVKHESLRSEMSVVPQECVLFDDTIYNNIAFSKPGATKDEVIKAMKFAQLYRIVQRFPEKEKTIVGERGIKLSGGEKQRVSIARAILANKKILVLDEATSALDSQTEHDIQADLAKLMEGRTSIVIAHRLSTIMSADKIIVMKEGKIVQMGTHRQLINQQGDYKKHWNLQKGGYIK
jgi:ATP-binding cassette, subfamily B, heavy metal transporter